MNWCNLFYLWSWSYHITSIVQPIKISKGLDGVTIKSKYTGRNTFYFWMCYHLIFRYFIKGGFNIHLMMAINFLKSPSIFYSIFSHATFDHIWSVHDLWPKIIMCIGKTRRTILLFKMDGISFCFQGVINMTTLHTIFYQLQ